MTLISTINRLENRLSQAFSSSTWLYKILLISIIISTLSAFPRYDYIYEFQNLRKGPHGAWGILCMRSANLMDSSILADGDSHTRKLTFRLVLPILLKLFHQNVWYVVVLQTLLGTFMMYLIAKIIYQLTSNKLTTFYFTLATTSIYFGISAFWELGGFGDSFAYGMLIIAMYYRNPIIIFGAITIASWTDERGFIAGGYVLFWWLCRSSIETKMGIKDILNNIFSKQTFAIIASWIGYILLRVWLTKYYNLDVDTHQIGGFMLGPEHSSSIGLGLWTSLEGFWIFILLTGIIMIGNWNEMRIVFWGYSCLIIFLCLTSCMVSDINRSISYGYPLILLGMVFLTKYLTKKELHYFTALIAVICLIHPLLMTFGSNLVVWAYPLPYQMIIFFFR
jgi:hypothetical protein